MTCHEIGATRRPSGLLLVVLVVVFSYGAYAAGTVDRCGTGHPEKWVWMPPHWQCL